MKICLKIIISATFLLCFLQIVSAQVLRGKWNGDLHTKKTDRTAQMKLTADAKGLQDFSFATSFYFKDTENYHECFVSFSRGDDISKWTTRGGATTITDADGNETIYTKTRGGFIIESGCFNTAFYKVAFAKRGNAYVGREISKKR